MSLYKNYFSFLRIALGNADSLPFILTDDDWHGFYEFCKRQALLGVGFSAVERLHEQGIECPKALRMQWMTLMLKIEKQNRILSQQCRELTERLEHDGLRCCILKGQGNLLNYPEHLKLRRNPGDIDVWCVAPDEGLPIAVQTGKENAEYETYHGPKAVREYIMLQHRLTGKKDFKDIELRYHHIEAPDMNGTPIEVHFRVGFVNSPIRNLRMQRWFDVQADVCMKNKTQLGFAVPTPSVNVVYQMTHLFNHYFDEGLGLRQLMDYYFVLKAWSEELQIRSKEQEVRSKEEVMHVLKSLGMGKFAAAVMFVLHEVFDMPTPYYICEPNEKEGRKLLAEIMQGGNFGQYDERGKDMKNGGIIPHALWKLKRVMRLMNSYPEEALCEPLFRIYHFFWRFAH